MMKEFELWKKTEVTGCVYEDESDTRKFSENFFLVSQEDEESFGESVADDYGYSDYSYQPDYIKIADLNTSEVLKLVEVFERFKQDYENKQMLKEIENGIENGNE